MKYIEIFIECIAIYFYLVFLLRFLGKKEMSQLSVSDLIVFLIISELMTMSIGNQEVNFFQCILASFVVVVLDKICSYLTLRSKAILKILEGNPVYLIYDGVIHQKKMKALNYSIDDLCHHLREQGIESISQVQFAVLETNGNLSVIEKDKGAVVPDSLISDGEINDVLLKEMKKDQAWLIDLLKQNDIDNYQDIFYCTLEKDGLFYVRKEYESL